MFWSVIKLSTGKGPKRWLLECGFWSRTRLPPRGEDHRAAGKGGVAPLGEFAAQEDQGGSQGSVHLPEGQCTSQTVTSDYADYELKNKAHAFHECKMTLSRQVCFHLLLPEPWKLPFRLHACANQQLSRPQGNFCIVTKEVSNCRVIV